MCQALATKIKGTSWSSSSPQWRRKAGEGDRYITGGWKDLWQHVPGAFLGLRKGTSHSGGGKVSKGFLKEVMLELSLEGVGSS